MIALQGTYDNGTLSLDFPAPVSKAKVLVIFPNKPLTSESETQGRFAAYRFGAAKGNLKFRMTSTKIMLKSPQCLKGKSENDETIT